jgi:hypothetical protein
MTARLSIPLPCDWRRSVKRALVTAVGLERLALLKVRAGFEASPDPRAALMAIDTASASVRTDRERSPPVRRARGELQLVVSYVGGHRELPIVELREAA